MTANPYLEAVERRIAVLNTALELASKHKAPAIRIRIAEAKKIRELLREAKE